MNKSQRIFLSTGDTGNQNQDKYIKVKLEQNIETLEFMSLSLGTADVYQNFNSDYGVLVGRVLANGGIGVENAKISIFIPVSDEDAEDPQIYSIYPYTTPRDENNDGKRYNLLPRVSEKDPITKQLHPKQAFGSFPIKEEVVGNLPLLDVYKKYYKYTALTNKAGDYMIFGVPIGTQVVHMSCDITDIGEYSMNPASMVINLGYPESQFTNQNTRIKPTNDLGDLPNIETQEIAVDVVPFWGDTENFEIGITRQDFRIRAVLTNTFTIFGSAFTDASSTMRGSIDTQDPGTRQIRNYFTIYPNEETETSNNDFSAALANKRVSEITEKIYYYPPEITDADIDNGTADPKTDMQILESGQYSIYKRNGDFVFIINCNRRRVITDDFGAETEVSYNDPNGVFTEFRGFVTLEYTADNAPMTSSSYLDKSTDASRETTRTLPLRLRLKFPQHANKNSSFNYSQSSTYNDNWRKQHMKFEAQKFYSFSTFLPVIKNDATTDGAQWNKINSFFKADEMNYGKGTVRQTIGSIEVTDYSGYNNNQYEMVGNIDTDSGGPNSRFGANWLNLSFYLPQIGYTVNEDRGTSLNEVRVADYLAEQWEDNNNRNLYFVFDNAMPIAGGNVNAKWFGRSDLHWTDIIEVPLADIVEMKQINNKGFRDNDMSVVVGQYRNGKYTPPSTEWKGTWSTPCPFNGGKEGGDPSSSIEDPRYYFYKGFSEADCIQFLYELGLVTE